MNNIFLNSSTEQMLKQQSPQELANLKALQKYYENMYNPMYGSNQQRDYIYELDNELKHIDTDVLCELNNNSAYKTASEELNGMIQGEIINIVRVKLNTNSAVISNIENQLKYIKEAKQKVKEKEKESIAEINDYMKNYSDMTFAEYKKLKE